MEAKEFLSKTWIKVPLSVLIGLGGMTSVGFGIKQMTASETVSAQGITREEVKAIMDRLENKQDRLEQLIFMELKDTNKELRGMNQRLSTMEGRLIK